jgi:hypothetical protein
VTALGLEPETFRFVAECRSQLCYRVPPPIIIVIMSQDNSVESQDYGLVDRWIGVWFPSKVRSFSLYVNIQTVLGFTQPAMQLARGLKRPGRVGDQSPPASTEVEKMWIYTSTPPYVKHRDRYTFIIIISSSIIIGGCNSQLLRGCFFGWYKTAGTRYTDVKAVSFLLPFIRSVLIKLWHEVSCSMFISGMIFPLLLPH